MGNCTLSLDGGPAQRLCADWQLKRIEVKLGGKVLWFVTEVGGLGQSASMHHYVLVGGPMVGLQM